jgi:hypothetical integral membrane protein (TIGR02206 family)
MARPFTLFGPDHLLALLLIAGTAVGLSFWLRLAPRSRRSAAVRFALAGLLLAATTVVTVDAIRAGARWFELLPFHLCDLEIFIAAFTLLTLRQGTYEVLYFWALGGTVLAVLTPDLARGFPDLEYVTFFGIHGGVIASASLLTWGIGMRPRPHAARRVFLLTNAYAALVGLVNLAAGTNYMYLCAKPSTHTLLDWMGPWPWYLLVADLLALAVFLALELPFSREVWSRRVSRR